MPQVSIWILYDSVMWLVWPGQDFLIADTVSILSEHLKLFKDVKFPDGVWKPSQLEKTWSRHKNTQVKFLPTVMDFS